MTAGPVRVLYVAGAGRSGSTLLGMLLGALPGMVAVGELRHIWRRGVVDDELCGCGQPFSRCPFWTEVGERAFGGWERAPTERMLELQRRVDRFRRLPGVAVGRLAPQTSRRVMEYAGVAARLYRAVSETAGGAAVVDTGKSVAFAAAIRRRPELDVRVVHLVRDPRAVAHSWTRRREMPEKQGGDAYMATFGPLQSSLVWAGNTLAAEGLRLVGVSVTTLRYEALVASPRDEAVARLARAMPYAAGALAVIEAAEIPVGPQHTVAGNPARFRTGSVRLRADAEWRTAMPPADRRLVTAVTSPWMWRFGYRLVKTRPPEAISPPPKG
jgi:hypothetical protein